MMNRQAMAAPIRRPLGTSSITSVVEGFVISVPRYRSNPTHGSRHLISWPWLRAPGWTSAAGVVGAEVLDFPARRPPRGLVALARAYVVSVVDGPALDRLRVDRGGWILATTAATGVTRVLKRS
jgi:hypothetical protein